MAASLTSFNLFCLLSSFVVLRTDEVNIQLYEHRNFTGLIWALNSTEMCHKIPEVNQRSIRTDTCFIAYDDPDCESNWSKKFMPGEIILSNRGWIVSVSICNEEEGGNQLNIDITNFYRDPLDPPKALESYQNVCSCVNVPQYVQNMDTWSIDNHHNDLLAYYEPDCSVNKWNFEFIAAGHNSDSREMYHHKKTDRVTNTTYKIQSLGPDPNSTYFHTSCSSFNFTTASTKIEESTTETVLDIETDLNNKRFQFMANQIEELNKKVDQLKEHLESLIKQQFDKLSERNTEVRQECTQNHQLLSDKVQKLESNLESKMKTQNQEFLEVIARLRAFLHGKL